MQNDATLHRQRDQLSIFRSVLFMMIEVVSLCWPAMLNGGHAIVFSDTRSYFVAGRAAIEKVGGMLHPHPQGATAIASLDTAIQKARAVRSVFYSVFTFASADAASLWLTILIQAVIVMLILRLTFRLLCPDQPPWQRSVFIVGVAAATTASWLVSTAMPDVFTAVAILGTILAVLYWDKLSTPTRWLLFVGVAGCTVMHLSNPPVIFGLLCVAALLRVRWLWRDRVAYLMVMGALLIALGTTLAVSVIGFKQWTLTPNQPPFLLARSIEDGPGRLYLQQHCPQIGLAMCNHLDRLDVNVDDFIWHDNGVYSVVSLEEAAQLRGEDKRVFVAAALEHPWMQIRATLRNWVEQLGFFTLQDFYIPSDGYVARGDAAAPKKIVPAYAYGDANTVSLQMDIRPGEPWWQMALAVPEYLIVLAGLGYAIKGYVNQRQRDFFILVCAGVLLNALVVALSVAAARYEARVIWLIPMAALLFAFRHLGNRGYAYNQTFQQA